MVHGVTDNQLHSANLIQHLELHDRINITEKNVFSVTIADRQIGHEAGQNVEVQLQGITNVDVLVITTAPMKSIALFSPEAFEIDLTLAEQVQVFLGEILSDNSNNPHRSKKTR